MVSLGVAIKRPFQDIKTAIVGIILGMIPIVNLLTIPGFALRNAKRSLEGDDSLLGWGDWGDIIVKSILLIVLLLIYVGIIIGIFLAVLGIFLGILGLLGLSVGMLPFSTMPPTGHATALPEAYPSGGISTAGINLPVMLGLATTTAPFIFAVFFILFILAIFLVILIPVAIMHWLRQESFTAGLAIPSLFGRVPYIKAIFYSLVCNVVLTVIGTILSGIAVIGDYLALGFVFYTGAVAVSTLFAQAYRELEQRA